MLKKCGFTLAETLLTMAIIGAVAALTIPSLMQSTKNKEYVSDLKKAYSTLSRATELLQNNAGPIKFWNTALSKEKLMEMYLKQMNIVTDCGYSHGCFANEAIKDLNGAVSDSNKFNTDSYYKFVTADGMAWAVNPINQDNVSNYGITGLEDPVAYYIFVVDVNGLRKPNTFGKDVFYLVVTSEGVLPAGSGDSSNCTITSSGHNCAAKIIAESKMEY